MSTLSSPASQGAVVAQPAGASALALAEARDDREGRPIVGVLWMVLAQVLFAAMNVLVRIASTKVPWSEVAASRALVGAATALGVAVARRAPIRFERRDRRLAWARSLCGTGAMLCGFSTLSAPALALGDAVTLGATSPIFVALLAPRMLGERSSRGLWIATAFAFAGVALVAGPTLELAGGVALIATLGALLSGFAMIWLRRLGSASVRASPESIALHFSLTASVVMIAISLPRWRTPDAGSALLLIATGLTGGLAQLAMTRAYALDRAARIGTVGYLGVVLSHLGAVGLGERASVRQLVGAALVVTAGLGLTLHALREARRAAAA